MARIICFDIETTGLDFEKGEKIIEIGAVEIIDGQPSGKTFQSYVNPDGRLIPASSYNIHKISNAFLTDKPPFKDVARRFLDFAADSPIVAHNGKGFDFPFINHQLAAEDMPVIAPERQIDSMLMAQRKIPDLKSYSLDSLAKYFNIPLDSRATSHGALVDTEILVKVYLELDKSADQKTVADIAREQHEKFLASPKSDGTFPRRTFTPTEAELAVHKEWIEKNIKKD